MLRVFRALRLISKNDGLKVAVSALFRAIPNVLNVAVIMVLFFYCSGAICISFFKGKLFSCMNENMSLDFGIEQSKWDCFNGGGEWTNQIFTFDDIPNALVTLFVMSTTVGWSEIVHYTITSSQIDYA